MQTRELTSKYLKKQLERIDKDDFEHWLQVTVGYAENYFGSNHQRIRLLKQVRLGIVKNDLLDDKAGKIQNLKSEARSYVNEFIDDLEDLKLDATQPSKIKYPLNLSQEVFWTVCLAIIAAAFSLGYYFGNNKFDKDKIDYYNQVRSLTNDTTTLNVRIRELDSVNIRFRNDISSLQLDTTTYRLMIKKLSPDVNFNP